MQRSHLVLTAAGFIAVGASVVAGLTIWLLVTAPTTVASAVNGREVMPLLQAVIGVIYQALLDLVRYL